MTISIGTTARITQRPTTLEPERACTCRAGVVCPACQAYLRAHQRIAPSAGQLGGRALSRDEVQCQLAIAQERLTAALDEVPRYQQRIRYWRGRVRLYTRWLGEGEGQQ
jgi:hypothetical protein